MAKKKSSPKKITKLRSPNAVKSGAKGGAPFNEHDPKRRLGNFGGAGEHPRQGGRTTGIVGQTKKRNRTDQRGSK